MDPYIFIPFIIIPVPETAYGISIPLELIQLIGLYLPIGQFDVQLELFMLTLSKMFSSSSDYLSYSHKTEKYQYFLQHFVKL